MVRPLAVHVAVKEILQTSYPFFHLWIWAVDFVRQPYVLQLNRGLGLHVPYPTRDRSQIHVAFIWPGVAFHKDEGTGEIHVVSITAYSFEGK